MSTFDGWFARKLDKFSQKTSTHRAYVALLCSQTTSALCTFGLHAQQDSSHIQENFLTTHECKRWFDLFETDGRRLPKVRDCIFGDKMQTSGVWLCIHFLVQNAVTDGIMRFRRKLFPQLSIKGICSRRVRGKGSPQHRYLPFVGKVDVIWPYDSRRETVDETMSTVIPGLIVLLGYTPPSPQIVFALRMAASLVCTQRRHHSMWQQLRKTIGRYLVDVAGLKHRRGSGLGFVEVSHAYRFQGWSQFRQKVLQTSSAIRLGPPSFQ